MTRPALLRGSTMKVKVIKKAIECEANRLLWSIRRRATNEQEVAWMAEQRGRSRPGGTRLASARSLSSPVPPSAGPAAGAGQKRRVLSPPDGVAHSASARCQRPIRQSAFVSWLNILTVESLARAADDGRMQPSLAESWTSERGWPVAHRQAAAERHISRRLARSTPRPSPSILPESLKCVHGADLFRPRRDPRVGRRTRRD